MTRLAASLCFLALLGSGCASKPGRFARNPLPPPTPAPAVADVDDADAAEESESENDAAEWALSRRIAPGDTELRWDAFDLASAQFARMPGITAAAAGRLEARATSGTEGWTPLGPGVVGGRTRSLVVNPKDPNILYAAAVTGGVWKSTDAGQHWKVLTDGLANMNVGALALDPVDPNIVYAGGGEQYGSFAGLGIFRSADAGATWTLLPGTARSNDFFYVNRIVVSPVSNQRLYAATRTGLMASRDGGATWSRALTAAYYGCQDLVIRSDQATDYLFAACSGATSTDTFSVYRNIDAAGAGSWANVYTAKNMGRSAIALAPSKQSTIYVASSGLGSPASARDGVGLAGVFRSAANGDPGSWTTQASGVDSNPFNFLLFSAAGSSTTAYCASGATVTNDGGTWGKLLAVDPVDSDRVWVGGVDLFRSDDGGLSWGVASEWDLSNAQTGHADRHTLVFHPGYDGAANQTAWQINDGGIFRTDNARAAVSTGTRAGCRTEFQANAKVAWTNLNTDYSVTQFYKGTAYPGGGYYFGGSQDTGINRGTDGNFNAWTRLGGGDGASVAIDPIEPARILFSSQRLALLRSLNGGATITTATQGITENAANFPFIASLAIDPVEPGNVYLGGATNLWRSTSFAASWTASAAVGSSGAVSAITVSPLDSNNVLFGTTQGFLFRSSNALEGAGAWTSVRPRTGNVSSIAFDPSTPGLVYAVYSSLKGANASLAHVYRSTDGGENWAAWEGTGTAAIPDVAAWRLLVNPRSPQLLYLGTDLGLIISQDGGATWGRDDGLPVVITEDLAFESASANYLFAFTFGRGVFRTPLPGAPVGCVYSVSPKSIAAPAEGGIFAVNVSTATGCAWSAVPGTNPVRFTLQSPAQGVGSGTAYITVPPVLDGTAAADTVSVAAQPVAISQPATTFQNSGNDFRATASLIGVPSFARLTARTLTASSDDPVHSCTKSADFATAWWQVTPSVSGFLSLQVRADRLDVFGNSGAVITVYAKSAPTTELTCATLARDTTGRTLFGARIPVIAGETYAIEIAALSSDGNNANYNLITSFGTADPTVTVTPASQTVAAGSSPVRLTAAVAGPDNKSVRWSISPPIGKIAQTGEYTPPATVAGSVDVKVTATSFADNSRAATVTVTVISGSAISATAAGLLSAATYIGGGVTPGQIAVLFGKGFGPGDLAGLTLTADGNVSTISGGATITFDGVPAPMIYAVNGQLSAIIPYAVAGKSTTQMQVNYAGQQSSPVTVPVIAAAPGLFTNDASGKGQAVVLNQDFSRNTAANPAARGSIVVFYGTGEGQTVPPGVDGRINNTVFPKPVLPLKVIMGGIDATVAYFGAAPGLVSGLFQANITVPAGVSPGDVPVVFIVGTASSPIGVTVAVK